MRPVLTRTLVTALAVGAAPLAHAAADTPRQVYDHYVECTSSMLAAQAGAAHPGDKGAAASPKLDAMLKTMRDKAVAAGAAISVPADRVAFQIGQDRDRRLRELNQPDAAKARQARKDVGITTLSCAFDELGKAIAARKAQAASAQAK